MNSFYPDFLGETARRIALKQYPAVRQFVVQHLYPDTLRLLALLHQHVPIDVVIGIGYSGNSAVVDALKALGIRVLTPDFGALQETVDRELGECLARCEHAGHELLLQEVGGYAIRSLHEKHAKHIPRVVGALEVTKQGVWVAESLPELKIPQLNIAQTRLKEIEGKMVGDAVAASIDTIFRELGLALPGRQAQLMGYGWVGRGCAEGLRARGMTVTIYDNDIIQRVRASVDGYTVTQQAAVSGEPFLILGASGRQSITADVIDQLPDQCHIISGASKDHEADLAYLQSLTRKREAIHEHVDAHTLDDGRVLFLLNKGYPVNFTGSSVPDEIVEFLFAEMILLVPELLDKRPAPGVLPLSEELEVVAAEIWFALR